MVAIMPAIIFESDVVTQYADGTMVHKPCGQPMTFDGVLMNRFNQHTCYTPGCPGGDRNTHCGELVPVERDYQDRKEAWRKATGND